jgi:polar amino acid transport system substrate-binding protein
VTAVIAGCGDDTAGSTAAKAAGDQSVAALVPAAVKSRGTLRVAADATYAPLEFIDTDGRTVVGADADLIKALADVMGLEADLRNVTFDSIIPGLVAKKYDLGASFDDTKEREQAVDFLVFTNTSSSFYTKTEGGKPVNDISDLCGLSVAVLSASGQADAAGEQGAACVKDGRPAVKVLKFQTQTQANLAVSSGRAALGFTGTAVATYQAKTTNGQFQVVGEAQGVRPHGFAIPKASGLDKPLLAALKVLMKDGTYASILRKWGIERMAIQESEAKINGAID